MKVFHLFRKLLRYTWAVYFVALLISLGVMLSDWKFYAAIFAMCVLVDLSKEAAK